MKHSKSKFLRMVLKLQIPMIKFSDAGICAFLKSLTAALRLKEQRLVLK